jgi:hypothetical protein
VYPGGAKTWPLFAPEPKVILTTGSPRLPVHSCAPENKEMKILIDIKSILIKVKAPEILLTDQVVLLLR